MIHAEISLFEISQSSTANTSITSTGANTPGSMLEKLLGSPKKAGSPRKPGGSPNKSPEKSRNPRFPKPQDQQDKITTKGSLNFFFE